MTIKIKNLKPFSNPSFKVKPVNNPQIINTHHEQIGGEWIEKPGTLPVIIGISSNENIDKTIEETFNEISNNKSVAINPKLLAKLHDCKHKLYAVRYHLETIREEISKRYDEFCKKYSAGSGVSFEQENQILIYETEAFLFQVKSNLDLIIQTLGFIVPSLRSFQTFAHSGTPGWPEYLTGGNIIKVLKKNSEKDLHDIFEKNRKEWIQDMTIWRDIITHYSKLKNFYCFVEEPFRGGDVTIHYPSMPNGEKLDDYCDKIYENLLRLYKEVFKIIKDKTVE
jgi:hypothetical protein